MQNISVIQFTQYIKRCLPEKKKYINSQRTDSLRHLSVPVLSLFNTHIVKMQRGLNPEQGVITLTMLKLPTSCPKRAPRMKQKTNNPALAEILNPLSFQQFSK